MQEEIISFETAKLAKEKGFNWECEYGFLKQENNIEDHEIKHKNDLYLIDCINEYLYAPTQSLLQKWLREVHKIYCDPILRPNLRYSWEINTLSYIDVSEKSFETYEEALEIGLQQALKLIK